MYCAAPDRRHEPPPVGRLRAAAVASRTNFDDWWTLPGHWVETPNHRRNGWSGVIKASFDGEEVYIKRQCNHQCRSIRHPLGWPTASREWHYLQRLAQRGIGAPHALFHGVRRTASGVEAVLATSALRGYCALDSLPTVSAAERRAIALALGQTLGRLHRVRLQHSCLYGKHVMIRLDDNGPPQVALLDLEKMRMRLTRRQAARHDLEQLQRRQHFLSTADWQVLLDMHDRTLDAP